MNSTRSLPPHPGRYIEEERRHLGITVQELAHALDIPSTELHQLIEGHASLTPDIAIRLATVIGSTPEMWLRLDHAHRAHHQNSTDLS